MASFVGLVVLDATVPTSGDRPAPTHESAVARASLWLLVPGSIAAAAIGAFVASLTIGPGAPGGTGVLPGDQPAGEERQTLAPLNIQADAPVGNEQDGTDESPAGEQAVAAPTEEPAREPDRPAPSPAPTVPIATPTRPVESSPAREPAPFPAQPPSTAVSALGPTDSNPPPPEPPPPPRTPVPGGLRGIVRDPAGPVAGLTVRLTGPEGMMESATSETGAYEFAPIVPGNYQMVFLRGEERLLERPDLLIGEGQFRSLLLTSPTPLATRERSDPNRN